MWVDIIAAIQQGLWKILNFRIYMNNNWQYLNTFDMIVMGKFGQLSTVEHWRHVTIEVN